MVLVSIAVLLVAGIASVVLWQNGQADERDFRVWAESLSTGTQVDLSSSDPGVIEFTDFVIVVESHGSVQAAGQEDTVVIAHGGDARAEARVRVFAQAGTPDQFRQDPGSHSPEADPVNELSVEVGILDERQVLVSSTTGSFPAASQIVLELDWGDGASYVSRMFTA